MGKITKRMGEERQKRIVLKSLEIRRGRNVLVNELVKEQTK